MLPNIASLVAAALLLGASAAGAGNVSLNGAAPRPFYFFAHNPNTVDQATKAIAAGANALEPDVSGYDYCPGVNPKAPLVIAHGVDCDDLDQNGMPTGMLTVNDYLDAVNQLAQQNPALALITFDIKSTAAVTARGPELVQSVQDHLNVNGVQLNVMYSASNFDDAKVFGFILNNLGPREAVMIDEENSVIDVSNYFLSRGLNGKFGYGDGTSQLGPHLPRSMDHAAFYRASRGYPVAVPYVWTIGDAGSMDWFISAGVDGIIPDAYDFFGAPHPQDLSTLTTLINVASNHPEVRPATRADNPLQPALQAYGLEIRTADTFGAGTAARLTFTLTGCLGSAVIVYDAGFVRDGYASGRMAQGGTDWVTIPSKDLGQLTSISVFNDGSDDLPAWKVLDIRVSSALYLGPDDNGSVEYVTSLGGGKWIDGGKQVSLDLTPNFNEPTATIQCPANISVPNAPDQCGAWVSYAPVAQSQCSDAVAVTAPPSGSYFPVGHEFVSSYASSAASGNSGLCLFQVQVVDTQPPLVGCPPDLTLNATSPDGAPLKFNNFAKDNCPGVSAVSCTVPSGSTFPISTTPVTCGADDAANNHGSCSFSVHVKGAGEQIGDLIPKIGTSSNALHWVEALQDELEGVLALMMDTSKPHTQAQVCKAMKKFTEDLESNHHIRNAVKADLVAAADRILAVMGCGTQKPGR